MTFISLVKTERRKELLDPSYWDESVVVLYLIVMDKVKFIIFLKCIIILS